LRRRFVELLAVRIDLLADAPTITPLAPFLAARLRLSWVTGVALLDEQPVVVLDLRRLAADLALGLRLNHTEEAL